MLLDECLCACLYVALCMCPMRRAQTKCAVARGLSVLADVDRASDTRLYHIVAYGRTCEVIGAPRRSIPRLIHLFFLFHPITVNTDAVTSHFVLDLSPTPQDSPSVSARHLLKSSFFHSTVRSDLSLQSLRFASNAIGRFVSRTHN